MKKLAVLFAAVVAAIVVVVIVRTMRFNPVHGATRSDVVLAPQNDTLLAAHLAGAIRFATISKQDSGPELVPMRALHAYLAQTFPRTYATLAHEVVAPASLLFEWKGSNASLEPIVMMSHLDVVPVEEGSQSAWTHAPFSGDVADGFVWGRGTLDDKVGVVSTLEAIEALVAKGYVPRRTIYLAFGDDEEVDGHGAGAIVSLLKSRGVKPLVAIDEGSAIIRGIIPGVARPAGLIGIAEKGHMSVALTVMAAGGHSSMPPPQTAVGTLAQAIDRLEKHPLPAHLGGAAEGMLQQLGPEMPLGARLMMANLWLTRPLVTWSMERSPVTNASLRTTTAPTMIQGSPKENVLPIRAQAIVNFRIIPGETPDAVIAHVKKVVDDTSVVVTIAGVATPPSPVSSTTSAAYRILARDIAVLEPDAIVAPSLVVAATDSRQYGGYAHDVYRFLPVQIGGKDLERIHGTNERIGIHDYSRGVAFMTLLISDLSSQ
ncbi:MAG: M20/M25/M40 family metallo-hydrolase [Gemmatimonadaceae bacterium]|nr:M20/M25/M40 family metallo-hydrolase [Gemmatimonadaceae bacterium]